MTALMFTAFPMQGSTTLDVTTCSTTSKVVKETDTTTIKVTKKQKKMRTVALPANTNNHVKTYMDYRTITDHSSKQWRMCGNKAYTDSDTGVRMIGDYYCVAMGSGISTHLGDKFIVTLKDGREIKVILAEQKADRDTDSTHMYVLQDGNRINIIEFVVDTDVMPDKARVMGDYNSIEEFNGSITSIKQILDD